MNRTFNWSMRVCCELVALTLALWALGCSNDAPAAAAAACDCAAPTDAGVAATDASECSRRYLPRPIYARDAGEEPAFNIRLADAQDEAGPVLRPFITCIRPIGDPGMAILGYENRSNLVITVAQGLDNTLGRGDLGSPPTVFEPGLHPHAMAIALFNENPDSWTLLGITVSSLSSRACGDGEQAERSTIPETEVPQASSSSLCPFF